MIVLQLLALLLLAGHTASLPSCENAIPPGEGFGGSVTITADCIWRPQLHFINTLTGEQRPDYAGALTTPTIYYEPAAVSSQAGPPRLSLDNVVLANFSLSSPGFNGSPVLWPKGMLQPGLQSGSTAPRRLYMNDVRIIVSSQTIQEYVRFFQNSSRSFWTDNATFIHLPYWSDDRTTAISVGLLLEVPGLEPVALALDKPAQGRNFVLAADTKTLLPVMQSGASVRTSVPFLMYLATNVSISPESLKVPILAVNRPLIIIGKSTDPTGIDLGMAVNTMQLGPQGSVLFNQVVLENLGPGDARSAALAGPYEPMLTYHVWAVAFDRGAATTPRLYLENVTMVVSTVSLEQYLVQATVFKVRPAGFDQQLLQYSKVVTRWQVQWVEDSDSVFTTYFDSAAVRFAALNMTAQPVIVSALPVPERDATPGSTQPQMPDYQLTHISQAGLHTQQLAQLGGADPAGPDARELIMLSTNITIKGDVGSGAAPPASAVDASVQQNLRQFLSEEVPKAAQQQHVLIGIVTPPITLDLSYTEKLVQLPPTMPAGHFALVNMMILHLSQGPKAALPDANVLLPDVWTHLLWSINRNTNNVVLLSNVTLWVPAAEFSFIRSHTATQPTSFTINLQGDANMRFYNVQDQRADGLFIERYLGPGLEAESLTLRVEPGWSMNGQPPRGFWATAGFAPGTALEPSTNAPRMSDAMVVVLAACLVTAVVASVLACLAFLFYRKRAQEHRLQAQRRAEAESGKAPSENGSHGPASHYGSNGNRSLGGSGSHSGSGLGVLATATGTRRSQGVFSGLLRDSMPVHDSSDSYNIPEAVDRAALTAELARSKFGPRNLAAGARNSDDSSGSSGGGGGGRRGRSYGGQLLPPAVGTISTTSMASDACLQRLQSAISVMSQDVLSRRLQYAMGADGSPVVMGMTSAGGGPAAGGLARPSSLGLGQQQQQQQQWHLTPPPEAADPDGNQQHSAGSLLARSSSSLGRGSIPNGSPSAAAAAEQLQRDGSGGLVDGQSVHRHGGPPGKVPSQGAGSAVWAAAGGAAAGGLAKSSYSSSQASRMGSSAGLEQLKLLQLVGQGTFGQVYKALWRRRCVAVKVLQLPATAGSSDVPWRGMGRTTSHREKMAVMETVVSTTMSHPNIVQVYTYVLQPLMQGSMHRSRKQHDSQTTRKQQQTLQEQDQQQLQGLEDVQEQQQTQQPAQAQPPAQQQEIELQQQQPLRVQGAAAQLLARFSNKPPAQQQQQQEQQKPPLEAQQQLGKLPPDPGVVSEITAYSSNSQQQQQQEAQEPVADLQRASAVSGRASSRASFGNDSSQSLSLSLGNNAKDLSRLTPEMAKAAAAALPAAHGVTVGAGADAGPGFHRPQMSGSDHSAADVDGDDGQDDSLPEGPVLVGWELRLVMEFCDAGSLRTALDHKLLIDRTTGLPALECVLFLAHDVACAMIHLHSEHLLHGDLKASNVLLKRTAPRLPVRQEQSTAGGAAPTEAPAAGGRQSGHARHGSQAGSLCGQGLGLMAKVADFGLSLTLGPTDTHVSQMHMGTLTHMAPELLLHGRASKASDVYAFGILLWELATGRRPYSGTPVGMLAHKVVQQGWRPAWPGGCSMPIKVLVEHCWTQDPADRPSFEQVVQQLEEMASHLDELKQQQAQAMAAAAAPLFHPSHSGPHDSDPGHELTPSMMAELMPSGFGPASGPSEIEEEAQCSGVLYEMSQLSDRSQDRAMHLDLGSDDADAAVVEGFDAGAALPDVLSASALCAGEAAAASMAGSRSHSDGSKHSQPHPGVRLAVVQ